MNTELEPEVIEAIQSGRKIDAIKKLRELRGTDLKEAKGLVDSYCKDNVIKSPSVEKVSSNNGLIFLIFLGIAAYFLYQYFA